MIHIIYCYFIVAAFYFGLLIDEENTEFYPALILVPLFWGLVIWIKFLPKKVVKRIADGIDKIFHPIYGILGRLFTLLRYRYGKNPYESNSEEDKAEIVKKLTEMNYEIKAHTKLERYLAKKALQKLIKVNQPK